jgi:hypothetical protein
MSISTSPPAALIRESHLSWLGPRGALTGKALDQVERPQQRKCCKDQQTIDLFWEPDNHTKEQDYNSCVSHAQPVSRSVIGGTAVGSIRRSSSSVRVCNSRKIATEYLMAVRGSCQYERTSPSAAAYHA